MEGMGLGPPVGPDGLCDPTQIGWAAFPVEYLLDFTDDGEEVRVDLIHRTTNYGLRRQWYLCRSN